MAGFYHRNIPRHGDTSVIFFVVRGRTKADSATKDKNQRVTRPRVPHSRARIRGRDAVRRGATFDGRRGFQPIRRGGADDTGMIRRGATMEGGGHRREGN